MKYFWHLPYLIATLIISLIALRNLDTFAGMGTPDLILFLLGSIALSHLIGAALGFLLIGKSWFRVPAIFVVALFPITLFAIGQARQAWYLANEAVYDRFRERLMAPIPSSVTNLEFVGLDEKHETHLMFRFSIAPEDLDLIIDSIGFIEITAEEFRRPDDLFTHEIYLPLDGPITFYTFNDVAAGYPDKGIGAGYTLKVSEDRKDVIFRLESAPYYLYEYWDNDIIRIPLNSRARLALVRLRDEGSYVMMRLP